MCRKSTGRYGTQNGVQDIFVGGTWRMKSDPLEESPALNGETFPVPKIDSNGVDRSQIRRQLERTPSERLRALESAFASIIRIRNGYRTIPTIDEIERKR